MKLADIINVIDENQLVKVIFRVYNAETTICSYPTRFKEVDKEFLDKQVKKMWEIDGVIKIMLKDE